MKCMGKQWVILSEQASKQARVQTKQHVEEEGSSVQLNLTYG